MRNWIRTDIDIGHRVRCFEFGYEGFREKFPVADGENMWNIEKLEEVFEQLKDEGYLPGTGVLVRVSMPPYKMCVCFWVQDSSFISVRPEDQVEGEYVSLKKGGNNDR